MITFTRVTQTPDPATGLPTPTTSTVTGSAIQVRGDPDTYKRLELIRSQAPTLFFTPTTYGELPAPGDTVVWPATNGQTYTVRDVDPIAPDGVAIAARVVITR
jgi:hypothetical protein